MTIQHIVYSKIPLNTFGEIVALNSLSYRMTLQGYVRSVHEDYIVFEFNDVKHIVKIRRVLEFTPKKERRKIK